VIVLPMERRADNAGKAVKKGQTVVRIASSQVRITSSQ
jgi:hypothetical protein